MGLAEPADARCPSWLDQGRIPCLDGLRALAIVLVVAEHATRTDGLSATTRHFVGNIGFIGVSAFFTLSGFLITLLLLREQRRAGRISIADFYRRRALRILPAYAAFLLALLALVLAGLVSLTSHDWVAALTYTMNFVGHPSWEVGHLWSLSVEEQFYVCWPLALLALKPARAVPILAGFLGLLPMVRALVLAWTGSIETIEQSTLLHIDAIVAGCLVALLSTNRPLVARFSPGPRAAALAVAVATAGVMVSYSAEALAPFQLRLYHGTLRYSVDALAFGIIVWCAPFARSTVLGRLLESRPFVVVGALSYSLYVWQQPFLNPHASRWFNVPPVSLLAALAMALLSYHLVESPFRRLKDGSRPIGVPS